MKRFLASVLFVLLCPLLALADRAVQVESLLAGLTDTSGEPLAGGLVYTYESGTSTPKSVYTDQAMLSAATNPVQLDAQGRTRVFASGAYKFVVKTADSETLYTWDNLQYVYPSGLALYAGTATGSSSAYSVTPSPALTAYTDGLTVAFVANHQNTGATTLNISSLGAKAVKRIDGTTALSSADITSGMLVNVQYIASSDHFRILNTAGLVPVSSGGTGAASASGARSNLGVGSGDSPTFTGVTLSGNMSVSSTTAKILGTSSDGSDNQSLSIGSASAIGTTRSAVMVLYGNEHAQAGQSVLLSGGNGLCTIGTSGTGNLEFYGNNSTKASMTSAGVFNMTALTATRGIYTDGSKNLVSTATLQTWSPTVAASGSMTVSSLTIDNADFWYQGPYIYFRFSAHFTLGGTASTEILIPAPVAGVADDTDSTWPAVATDNGTAVADPRWNYDGTNIRIFKPGVANNWTLNAITVHVQGAYRAN
jgi:hypothetical protein